MHLPLANYLQINKRPQSDNARLFHCKQSSSWCVHAKIVCTQFSVSDSHFRKVPSCLIICGLEIDHHDNVPTFDEISFPCFWRTAES